MVFDQRSAYFHNLRSKSAVIVYPIQILVDSPVKSIHWFVDNVTSQRNLLAENSKLRANELLLEAKLQKMLALEQENKQLRVLLKSTTEVSGRVLVAEMLAVALSPLQQQMIIDKGIKEQVYRGQPVLDAYGVMGQVVDVGSLTSKVLLITDTQSAVPVQSTRNGIRAIATGLGSEGQLSLINVPDTVDIKEGDVFVTSGLGLNYPVGYPVAMVSNISHVKGERFAVIKMIPAAHLTQSQQVLLVWPPRAPLSQEVQKQLNQKIPIN